MDNEQIINGFIGSIATKVPVDDLEIIRSELLSYFKDYTITPVVLLPEVSNTKPIPEALDKFIVSKQLEGLSPNSIKQYKYILELFFNDVIKPLNLITPDDVRLFMYNKSLQPNVSKSYIANIRCVLRSFFSWCYKEEYIRKNPMDNIPSIKYSKKQVNALTEKQLELCRMKYVDLPLRDQTIFEFCYSTGCRAAEVCNLRISDIDYENKTVRVHGKGDKYRNAYLNEKVLLMLNKYFDSRTDSDEHIFVKTKKPYTQISVSALEDIFAKIGERAGIKLHPHMMRHTTATMALNRGMPLEEVQQLLGHSSPDTTLIYASINNDNVKYHHQKYLT